MRARHAALRAAADRMRTARALFALFLFAGAIAALPLKAADFSGGYDGIGEAAGVVLTLSEAERRVVGRLTLPSGTSYALNGERAGAGEGDAQGVLHAAGASGEGAFFHVEERPLGLQFLFIPARADGTPDLASAREYSLLKRGVRPTVPREAGGKYRPAPEETGDLVVFIDGFRSWAPYDIAQHYAALPDKARGLLLLYDHATAELMWRICEAQPDAGTDEALRLAEIQERQQVGCGAYLPMVEAAQRSGLFPEFLRRSLFQLELVRATTLCGRGETPAARCADVSALAAPLVLRWRRADAIMTELARAGGVEAPEAATGPVAAAGDGTSVPDAPPPPSADAPVPEPAKGAGESSPLPLARPAAEDEGISDFEPDVSMLPLETIKAHRLPLSRP
jgi:hypothetical protein